MKHNLFISAIILSVSVLSLNAQIYTPTGVIQGSSVNNNVGIGISSPQQKLDVDGTISTRQQGAGTIGSPYETVALRSYVSDPYAYPSINWVNSWNNNYKSWMNFNVRDGNHNKITVMTIDGDGRVGIGKIPTTYAPLQVAGRIEATSLALQQLPGGNNTDLSLKTKDGTGYWSFYSANWNGEVGIYDALTNTNPFVIQKGAVTNSIYVSKNGEIGIGTNDFITHEVSAGYDFKIFMPVKAFGTTFGLGIFEIPRLVFGGTNTIGEKINTAEIFIENTSLTAGVESGKMHLRTKSADAAQRTAITIDENQNVGIGNLTPFFKLDVIGTTHIYNGGNQAGDITGTLYVGGREGAAYTTAIKTINTVSNPNYLAPRMGLFTLNTDSYLAGDLVERVSILAGSGNVGIGTANPGNYKLNVSGKIRADEIVVNTSGADFVFAPEYKLATLSEVDSFIKENNHLPGMASADEMKEYGISVSEMQTKLLQKIEEMTLYLLEQNKKMNDQYATIIELKREIIGLKCKCSEDKSQ